MDKVPLTLNGFESLNEELKYLKSIERPNIIKAIAEAREHGDLIPANIIYTKNKKIFTFIDLEDMFYSFFPIEFDLSLFIERTILKLNISNKKKIEFVKIFLLNYFRNNKKKLQFPIVESIKFNSLKSILMLITIYNNKNKLNKKELNKFIDLYYSKINFLKKIDQEYLSYDKN